MVWTEKSINPIIKRHWLCNSKSCDITCKCILSANSLLFNLTPTRRAYMPLYIPMYKMKVAIIIILWWLCWHYYLTTMYTLHRIKRIENKQFNTLEINHINPVRSYIYNYVYEKHIYYFINNPISIMKYE